MKEALCDTKVIEKILQYLDLIFDYIVVLIEQYKDIDSMTIDQFMDHTKRLKRNEEKLGQTR